MDLTPRRILKLTHQGAAPGRKSHLFVDDGDGVLVLSVLERQRPDHATQNDSTGGITDSTPQTDPAAPGRKSHVFVDDGESVLVVSDLPVCHGINVKPSGHDTIRYEMLF